MISKIYTFPLKVFKNNFGSHTINRMSIGLPDAALNVCVPGKLSLASGPIAQIACWFCKRLSMYISLPLGVITFLLKLQNT